MTGNPVVDAAVIHTWRLGCTLGGSINPADITGIGGQVLPDGSVTVPPDGQLTVDDVIVFTNAYGDSTGCPGATPCNTSDLTAIGGLPSGPDGQLTVDDIIAFTNSFSEGCGEE